MPVHKIVIKSGAYTLEMVMAAFEPSDSDSFVDATLTLTETGDVIATGRVAMAFFNDLTAIEVKI